MSKLPVTYCLPAIAKVLKIVKVGKPLTPSEINRAAGNGDYAAKYVMLMRKYYGFDITVQKDAKRVVSYTVIAEPDNVAALRAYTGRDKTAKPAKAAKPVKTVTVAPVATTKAKPTKVAAKAAAAKASVKPTQKKSRTIDPVEQEFGSTGEIATSFSLDPGWDSVDESVLPKFLR